MFVNKTDYAAFIKDTRLNQILDAEPYALDEARAIAQSTVNDALYSRYDTAAIFAKVGTARDMQVVRWIITLSLYYLYERLPDKLVPERIIKNYDDTLYILTEIEDGKKSVALPVLLQSDAVTPISKFRFGSNPKRTH
jgi:hypothetical protein